MTEQAEGAQQMHFRFLIVYFLYMSMELYTDQVHRVSYEALNLKILAKPSGNLKSLPIGSPG